MTTPLQPVSGDNAQFDTYCAQLREQLPANGRLLLVQIPQVILGSFNRDIALKRGYYADGGGLYLQVSATGSKSWVFRYRGRAGGRLREMGLLRFSFDTAAS